MAKTIFPKMNDTVIDVTTEYDGNIMEFGSATAYDEVGVVTLQFNPSETFEGEFIILARTRGEVAKLANVPLVPVQYIVANCDNVAADRSFSSAPITGSGIIEVPSNGLSIGALIGIRTGSCQIAVMRLAGTAASL